MLEGYPPASSKRTEYFPFSDNREAATAPADPPPTLIEKSFNALRFICTGKEKSPRSKRTDSSQNR